MIINANGVNRDTNTMRTDAEIINLIKNNTVNMTTRTLLKTLTVNQNITQTSWNTTFGGFTLSESQVLEYGSLYIEFKGSISMSSNNGNGGVDFELINGDGEILLAVVDVYANYPTTLSDFSVLLSGSTVSKRRSSTGATTTYRSYGMYGSSGSVSMNGSQCSFKLSGYNNIGSGSINGTINIYGVK